MTAAVMTIREVALALRLTEKTVYCMANDGELPAFKVRGQWRILQTDFAGWLALQIKDQKSALHRTTTRPLAASHLSESDESTPVADEKSSVPSLKPTSLVSTPAVTDLSERVDQPEMHQRLVAALGAANVLTHAAWSAKPFEMDLVSPLPQRVRVYMYNATRPPGGRPLGEHKIQLIVPGQRRDQRASFDHSDGRIVLLVGYAAEEDVFVLWDAGLYADFAWSRNVQVKPETIVCASAGRIATQQRRLRPPGGKSVVETVVAASARDLADALVMRMDLTRERLMNE